MWEITRRQFLAQTAAALAAAELRFPAGADEPPHEDDAPRNVIVWITGRQRADSLGCYGNPVVRTPHLDRLASEGVLFTNYRTVIPQLSPSRASLMTGLYPHAHHVLTDEVALDSSLTTLGEVIRRETEMVTGYIGKWGLGRDKTRDGFVERAVDILPSDISAESENDYANYLQDNNMPKAARTEVQKTQIHCAVSPYPEEHCVTTYLAHRALEFIDASWKRPFFLLVSDPSPQHPFSPPHPWQDVYDPSQIPVTRSASEDLSQKPRYQVESIARRDALDLTTPEHIQRLWTCYLGLVSLIDKNIGRVLDRIDHLGITGDTLFVFTSDLGDLMGSHAMVGTGPFCYEELLRVPLILRWPRRWQPATIASNVAAVDFMPSLLDILSLPVPEGIHGRSVLSLIERNETPWPNVTFGECMGQEGRECRLRMVLKDRRKYVLNLDDEDEFYDLETDPDEMVNLLHDPRRAPDAEPLRRELLAWMKETGDPLLEEANG